MKTLYLVRHAKSSWSDSALDDADRPLNARGEKDGPRMGKRLRERHILPQLIVSSPARRAMATAKLIAEEAQYPFGEILVIDRLYGAGQETLLSIVQNIANSYDDAMVVAHNPGLTDFANSLSRAPVTDNMPTCAIIAMHLPTASWKETSWRTGEVLFFDFPKNQ